MNVLNQTESLQGCGAANPLLCGLDNIPVSCKQTYSFPLILFEKSVNQRTSGTVNAHLRSEIHDSSSLTNEKDHHYFLNSADVCW